MSSLLQRMSEARRNFQERKNRGSNGTTHHMDPNDVPASPRADSSVHSEHSVASACSDGGDFHSEEERMGSPIHSSHLSQSLPGSLDFFMKRWSRGSNNNNNSKVQQETTKPMDIPSDSSPVDSPVASAPQGPGWSSRRGHVEKAANVTKSFRDVWLTPD
ncbi:uncharacterized protein Gasu_51650 [Galdieria sulphuraria]|uniref:Uncharacterized protein n=1 Tax=Galdieria sulphuraria TaxID=130081 RepID=M2VVQ7_GALSU|nr:uncharacterized protein Gasu_51650 [Galdieria sulphuraria]EME27311.1 hypothetical protein Gasu_51650 [Galdieria sulphuraria]|eukprot:XP_005703831.1 hypothetical protein Gasu_51650 [Galdieria sulphuraria]